MRKLDFPPVMDPYKLAQKAFAAHNNPAQRSSGRKMSADTTTQQIITSLTGYADGYIRGILKGFTAINLLNNGSFESNFTGWTASLVSVDNTLCQHGSRSAIFNLTAQVGFLCQVVKTDPTHKYFISVGCYIKSTDGNIPVIDTRDASGGGNITTTLADSTKLNQWQRVSTILNSGKTGGTAVYLGSANAERTANFNIDSGMMIDLTLHFGVGNEPTQAQCELIFPTFFEGIKSTQAQRIKVTGKNLFKTLPAVSYGLSTYKSGDYWVITSSTGTGAGSDSLGMNRFKPNTRYAFSGYSYEIGGDNNVRLQIFYTDGSVGQIFIPSSNETAFSVVSDAGKTIAFIGWTHSSSGTTYLKNFQIEEGTTPTAYEPYTETVVYVPSPLRSLPNNMKDEINLKTGQKIQNVSDVVTNIHTLTGWTSGYELTNTIRFNRVLSDVTNVATSAVVSSLLRLGSLQFNILTSSTTVDEEGFLMFSNGINIRINKSRLASLDSAGFEAWLQAQASSFFIYQFLKPVLSTYKDAPPLDVLPYGNIIIEPILHGTKLPAFSTGKIAVTTADAPIANIESVYRIDTGADGQQVKIDVTSSFTVDADKLGITYASADYTKPHEYTCLIDPAYSTIPSLTYSYPEADAVALGIATKDYGAAAADWILSSTEQQCGVLVCTNASSAANIIAPDRKGSPYFVKNSSGQTLTLKKSGGTGATIATGKKALFIHTGSDYEKFFEL